MTYFPFSLHTGHPIGEGPLGGSGGTAKVRQTQVGLQKCRILRQEGGAGGCSQAVAQAAAVEANPTPRLNARRSTCGPTRRNQGRHRRPDRPRPKGGRDRLEQRRRELRHGRQRPGGQRWARQQRWSEHGVLLLGHGDRTPGRRLDFEITPNHLFLDKGAVVINGVEAVVINGVAAFLLGSDGI